MSAPAPPGATVRLHRLTMVPEEDGVMVGRPDVGSYALFPREGAEALRMLGSGVPVPDMAAWYQRACGSQLDVDDFLAVLEDLGFLRAADEDYPDLVPVRWQRLGRWAFSWPAWLCYVTVIAVAAVAMARQPWLRPSYRDMFFTHYLSLIPLALTAAQIPCILLHESFHALAGRRLGLPSALRLGRRLYYIVAETRLDALHSVPRRQRYLPFLAGMLADAVLLSVLTLLAALLKSQGVAALWTALLLAVAFTGVLRLIWQLMFYLETDLYFVLSQALRCRDLQNATRYYLRTRFRWLPGSRPAQPAGDWSDRDREMARWYAPIMVAGYGFSLASLAWAAIPAIAHFLSLLIGRLTRPHPPAGDLADAASFIALIALQLGVLAYVTVRDRRLRSPERALHTSSQGAVT
jgi:hypothetical protein